MRMWIYATGPRDGQTILVRSFYPQSVSWKNGEFHVTADYSAVRPGLDNDATVFVEVNSPHWGNIWVKNKRSKDDIGHMLRALATTSVTCGTEFRDEIMLTLAAYRTWASSVVENSYGIPTLDKNGSVYVPRATLAHYSPIQVECNGRYTIALLAGQPPPDCGEGFSWMDRLGNLNHQNNAILQSHHEAALAWTRYQGMTKQTAMFLKGLQRRVDQNDVSAIGVKTEKEHWAFLVHSAILGIQLSPKQIKWVQQNLQKALRSYHNQTTTPYDLFSQNTPDGEYPFNVWGDHIHFRDLGLLYGLCSSKWVSKPGAGIIDCEKLAL
jgi:hypothetical protein